MPTTGTYTPHVIFYKPGLGASGTDEKSAFDTALDTADTLIYSASNTASVAFVNAGTAYTAATAASALAVIATSNAASALTLATAASTNAANAITTATNALSVAQTGSATASAALALAVVATSNAATALSVAQTGSATGSAALALAVVATSNAAVALTTATSAIPKSIGTTKGNIIVFTGSATPVALAPSTTNGDVLTIDTAQAGGVAWSSPTPKSNVLFSYAAPHNATGGLVPWRVTDTSTQVDVITTKWIKVSCVSTLLVYGYIGNTGGGSSSSTLGLTAGGNGVIVTSANTGETVWVSTSLNVSTLSNGTIYDVAISLRTSAAARPGILQNVVIFGT
jgi:hypothetical protein